MKVVSLIEPLYELAVVKILHNRYPDLGKYQMSCFPDENEYGKHHHWCGHCSKCARIYIFLKANGILPKRIGFKNDMLMLKYKHLYSLFGVEKKEGNFVNFVAESAQRFLTEDVKKNFEISPGVLGEEASSAGAALLCRREIFMEV